MKKSKRCCLAIVAFIFSISLHHIMNSYAETNGGEISNSGAKDSAEIYSPEGKATLYEANRAESETLGTYYNGHTVRIEKYGEEWCYVNVSSIYSPWQGFMQTKELFFNDVRSFDYIHKTKYAELVADESTRIYERPDNTGVSHLYLSGTIVHVFGEYQEWWHVEAMGGYGFVSKKDAKTHDYSLYSASNFPIPESRGKICLSDRFTDVSAYASAMDEPPVIWNIQELLGYNLMCFDIIAEFDDWYQVRQNGHQYIMEKKYFE